MDDTVSLEGTSPSSPFWCRVNLKEIVPDEVEVSALLKWVETSSPILTSVGSSTKTGDSTYCYAPPVMECLLFKSIPIISSLLPTPVYPVNSLLRRYYKGGFLKEHIDREALDYTLTLTLAADFPARKWPIYAKVGEGEGLTFNLDVGEGLLFTGRQIPHWRNTLEEGNLFVNVYLHYTAERKYAFDGRKRLDTLSRIEYSYQLALT